MSNIYLIHEHDEVNFENYNELSYRNKGHLIEMYVNDMYEGDMVVYKDSEMNDREFVNMNYEITYLDTLTRKK